MPQPQTFTIRLLAAVAIGDRRFVAGARVKVDAIRAAELIRASRATLANDADVELLARAVAPRRRYTRRPPPDAQALSSAQG